MLHTVAKPETVVNSYPDETAVFIVLTDGEDVHDARTIHPNTLPHLNQIAQTESNGELWWELQTVFIGRKYGIVIKPEQHIPFDLTVDSFTPLAIISSNLELYLNKLQSETAVSTECLQIALAQVKRLAQLLRVIQSHFFEVVPFKECDQVS